MALRKVGPQGFPSIKSYPVEAAVLRGTCIKAGAAIGGAAGAVMSFLGFGARSKAASYDKNTAKPQLAFELAA